MANARVESLMVVNSKFSETLYLAPGVEDLFELPREKISGNPLAWLECLDDKYRKEIKEIVDRARQSELDSKEKVRWIREHSRNEYPLQCQTDFIPLAETKKNVISSGGFALLHREIGTVDLGGDEVPRQEVYREIIENLTETEVVFLYNKDFTELIYVNDRYEEIYGGSIRELRENPDNIFECIHPDDREEAKGKLQELIEGNSVSMEYRVNPDENYSRWVWAKGNPVFNEEGEVKRITGFVKDITERKVAEEALQESERRFHEITDHIDEVIYLGDPTKEEFLYVNEQRYEEIYGGDAEGLRDDMEDFMNYIHPEDRERVEKQVEKLFDGERVSIEYRVNPDENFERWVWSEGIPIKDDEGNVVRTTGFVKDITRRKEAQQKLEETQQHLRDIAENLDEVIYLVNREWTEFLYVNERYEEIFGGDLDTLLEEPDDYLNYVHPEDRERVAASVEKLMEGEKISLEYRVNPDEDFNRWVWSQGIPITDKEGNIKRFTGFGKDITRRKKIQEELQESEARFRQITENIDEVIYLADAEWNQILYVNKDRYEEVFGGDYEELMSDPYDFVNCIHPEDRERVKNRIETMVEKNERIQLEYRVNPDEDYSRWVWGEAIPITDDDGNVVRFTGFVKDISERKKVQQELRNSEERFRQLAENIEEVFYLVSESRDEVIYISPAYEDVWGISRESLYEDPDSWMDLIHPEDRLAVREHQDQVKQREEGRFDMKYRIVREDGETRWIHDRSFPVRNEEREVHRIAGIAEDITEERNVREELRKSEEKFRQLAENVDLVFWMSSGDLEDLIYISPPFEDIWGLPTEEVLKNPGLWIEMIHPEDREKAQKATEKEVGKDNGEGFGEEYRIVRPDGEVRWIRDRAFPVRNEKGEVYRFAGVAEDITELKEKEEELQRALDDSSGAESSSPESDPGRLEQD